MESVGKLARCSHPFHLSFLPPRPSFPNSISFRTSPSPPLKFHSIRASASDSHNPHPPKPLLQTLAPVLKTACVTLSAAAALLFIRLQPKPAVAAPVTAPTVEPSEQSAENNIKEEESTIEEHVNKYPDDVESLRSLMEVKIKSRKLQEAIEIIDRLIELEPDENEWPLLKANLYNYSGDFNLAKKGFEEILEKDPDRVEAYHGLVMAGSESGDELKGVLERIKAAMERCRKKKKTSEVRDFKLLIAQVKVIEGNYAEALKVYEELVKEEPRDFRPYLCQGIIYTLLRKNDEAEKKFKQYRRLVPKNHPYAEYFDDNMIATKFFAQKAEREMAGSRG
ncbi:protein SLOW GREEN 1, chloroplastic-like [Punica granatum]|uniref:Protein SLOW GREEN 1, chloroplastic-like n=2 Tax=Punica granatum TaxID=22663 RepID=A0A218XDB1_PUNGR|nr:protein SLOW GREEN 1, chloroplastic-like [Punica granatum]OWM82342.1 hypothetical protein CDL15_Pgr001916 [Punica granatum]